ncbi:MAG: HD-GYP domain-containing protein [Actinomycetota bacterium]|nr:HD-GYP domain-containing protein [Actinomycetota bacterium]
MTTLGERTDDQVSRSIDLRNGALTEPLLGLERILSVAREQLAMDLAFVSAFEGDDETFIGVCGDSRSFGIWTGGALPTEETLCARVLSGDIPAVIGDTDEVPAARGLSITEKKRIGAYIGEPLVFSDGRVFGMLCCLNHMPKPDLGDRERRFLTIFARLVAVLLEQQELEKKNTLLAQEATGVHALLAALEARDGYTGEHSRAVVDLCGGVAEQMNVGEAALNQISQVALLHDLGKIGIPDSILRKPDSLSPEEWNVMRRHPAIGAQVLRSISALDHLAPAVRAEHERWDGHGYPDGLQGEDIPLASRIVFACDAYHAMVSDRPYRTGMPPDLAVTELERNAGSQFCPRTVLGLLTVLATKHAEELKT